MEFGGNNGQKEPFFFERASFSKRWQHHRVDDPPAEEEVKVRPPYEDNGHFGVGDHAIDRKAAAYIDKFHAKNRAPGLPSDQVAEKAST